MRRRLLTVAIFLLAGAVVNVAVAWGILWKKDWATITQKEWSMGEWPWPRDAPVHWPDIAKSFDRSKGFGVLMVTYGAGRPDEETRRAAFVESRLTTDVETFSIGIFRAGWPMPALEWEDRQDTLWHFQTPNAATPSPRGPFGFQGYTARTEGHPPKADWWVYGMPVELSQQSGGGRWRNHLPVQPVWPNFAVNTILYAAILWLIIPGPFVLRRLIRRRRGLCPKCGYDLRHGEHQACPECGVTA